MAHYRKSPPCPWPLLVLTLIAQLSPAEASNLWFVNSSGHDDNTCSEIALPCATITGALSKAAANDTIKVTSSIYPETVEIEKNITLSGGWNNGFSLQQGVSVIDGEAEHRGVIIHTGATASMEYFTITNGAGGSEGGGGIYSEGGNLTLRNSSVSNCSAHAGISGGGILLNGGNFTLDNSSVSHNQANQGGGIFSSELATLTITDSLISDNTASGMGGGLYLLASNVSIANSAIVNNAATPTGRGGGLFIDNLSNVVFTNTTLSGNSAGWDGGAIYKINTTDNALTFNNTTISQNSANTGGGLYADGNVVLRNSIVAENQATTSADCTGPIRSAGYNLIGNASGCQFTASTGDQLNVIPFMAPLNDAGAKTTLALKPGSPAIDGGNPAGCRDQLGGLLTGDQRGMLRPQGKACDIGAVEASEAESEMPVFNYFPVAAGNRWDYLFDKSDVASVKVLNKTAKINGSRTQIFSSAFARTEMYFTNDQKGVRLHGFRYNKVPVPGYGLRTLKTRFDPPVLIAHPSTNLGKTLSTNGTMWAKFSGLGKVDIPFSASFSYLGLETVEVPAGNYPNAMKIQGTINMPDAGNQLQETFYLAKGIGIIKQEESMADESYISELQSTNAGTYDLAVVKISPPKKVLLTAKKPAASKTVKVTIQNRSPHVETIRDVNMLAEFVNLEVESLGSCPSPTAELLTPQKLQKRMPLALKPKKKFSVKFSVTFDCANNPVRDKSDPDFRYIATVDHQAIDEISDTHPQDDSCPYSVTPPYRIDPYPDGKIKDKGCGTRTADGVFGGDVVTDIYRR